MLINPPFREDSRERGAHNPRFWEDSKNSGVLAKARSPFIKPPFRGCVAIVIARSEMTKQSLFIDEIATLPSVARNDKGGYDTAPFGRTPNKEKLNI